MSGWPDPARPGVPLSPERDGWHWVTRNNATTYVMRWDAKRLRWGSYDYHDSIAAAAMERWGWHYLAPCLTPAEVVAREAAAFERGAEAERRETLAWLRKLQEDPEPSNAEEILALLLDALPAQPVPEDEE